MPSKAVAAGEKKHSTGGRPAAYDSAPVYRCVLLGPKMLLKIGRSHIQLWISGFSWRIKGSNKIYGPTCAYGNTVLLLSSSCNTQTRLHHLDWTRASVSLVPEKGLWWPGSLGRGSSGALRVTIYQSVGQCFNGLTTDVATLVHTGWMWWWGIEVKENGNTALLKDTCDEQENEQQNMSSLQCQAKEVPLTASHKRRREWMSR